MSSLAAASANSAVRGSWTVTCCSCALGSHRQRAPQEAHEVAVRNELDVGLAVAAGGEERGDASTGRRSWRRRRGTARGRSRRRGPMPMPQCLALPASWQMWSMWSTRRSSVTPALSGVDWPRTQPGTIIQASKAAPMTAPRAMSSRSWSSLNWRLWLHERAAVRSGWPTPARENDRARPRSSRRRGAWRRGSCRADPSRAASSRPRAPRSPCAFVPCA